jgi:hypothetical protein
MRERGSAGLEVAGVLFLAAALGACSTAAPGPRTGRTNEGVMRTTGSFAMEVPLTRNDVQFIDTLSFDAARAWAELPAVYRTLGLPVNESDAKNQRLAVIAHQPRTIEGQRVSHFLDCGRGLTAGEYADAYQVYLWVETRLITTSSGPEPARGAVQSTLTANARPRAVSGNPVPCVSLGRLERRIVELLQARLAGGGGG